MEVRVWRGEGVEVRVGGYLKDTEVVYMCACVHVCCKLFDIVVGM